MGASRTKSPLSKTAQSYCQEWLKSQIYGTSKEINTKYFDKGNECEDEAIDFAAEQLGWGMAMKNEEQFANDFLTGTPDVILANSIEDIKCPWDCFTFPLFDTELPEKDYYWQMQGYMALTGKQSAGVVYCLMDYDGQDWSHVDPKHRIKRFEVKRDEKAIEAIKAKVEECRKYINTLVK